MMTCSEVVARKSKFAVGRVIINAVALVFLWSVLFVCIFGSDVFVKSENSGVATACIVLLALVTVFDCVLFIYAYIKWKALPDDVIIFSDGKLFIAGRAVELSEIVYASDSGEKTAGSMVFSFKDGCVQTVRFIDDVEAVSKRINQLLLSELPRGSSGHTHSAREVLGIKAKSGRYKILVGCAAAFSVLFVICVLGAVAMFIGAENGVELAISTFAFSGLAVVCLCSCIVCINYYRHYKILPRELLTKCGDDLYYAGAKFDIGCIARIEYKGYPQNNYFKDTGVLTFYFNDGTKLKCRHFFQPHAIYRDLQNIIAEFNNQKIADKMYRINE